MRVTQFIEKRKLSNHKCSLSQTAALFMEI